MKHLHSGLFRKNGVDRYNIDAATYIVRGASSSVNAARSAGCGAQGIKLDRLWGLMPRCGAQVTALG